MDVVDISRWQFGITTVYHFIFVPLTLGMAPLVAIMQTMWAFTSKPHWYRATRFFGNILLVNFAMGVATGIVQEFQFGMNWSEYSRMVGDVFGGPLALEGLIAFFMESVFLGMWIFGWGKLPLWMHTGAIWMVAFGVNISAYFIIVANSFMQHPVGAEYNPSTHRAELADFGKLLTNPTALAAFPHTVLGGFLTAGTFVLGISCWWLVRADRAGKLPNEGTDSHESSVESSNPHTMYRPLIRFGIWVVALSSIALAITGDTQAKMMFRQQPMKMASAESLCHTQENPMFSILTIGTHNNCESVIHLIEVPWVLPFLAKGQFTGVTLKGVFELQKEAENLYGPGNYSPNLFVTYWSFRAMIGLMLGSIALAFFAWFFTRHGRTPQGKWQKIFSVGSIAALAFPFLANSSGWIFTEMGRQPWIVHPNPDSVGDPRTEDIRMIVDMGVTDHAAWNVILTLTGFTLTYLALFFVWLWLTKRAVLAGPPEDDHPSVDEHETPDRSDQERDSNSADEVGTVRFSQTAVTGTKGD
ncbi:cytochrome ubiquinol oxidase subunit I [Corynebacterium pseudokroppenstedtii]|uniref:Cytochrome ubiquinol oxidase subunit I n=1 Tax=Corynebacterium pseudokroppenstedtii TaxID=2804917 RepID=A0AAU0Q3L6_9CORY|nr:cytochrome ubiquinol oxidase subunit I [Corynebacterium pseudokroppenstedtii]MDU6478372.1 cytochrome ubiquinol oxidase subunit I [Corynebacterium kroppenstedtii]MBY0790657.1 cytochrome ubiquinol oxidase subunit I [Corynebacterium pseudokroppenstedtii]MCF6792471.1 cytochrome ubiquinol oxidase subunit I [Corynebacterium pseudokroppenstedtii]MCF8702409.1 cytochrome ubiquinol oxidase subunit I [Corynebacterium pseudokroppenstedtii]MCG2635927.1 cytochrome ubiquinol oxidase subunit I [Corynebacte